MALVGSEKSKTWLFFILSHVLLFLAVFALYDEGVRRRPWKQYQYEFNKYERQVAVKEYEKLKKDFNQGVVDKKIKKYKKRLEEIQIAKESDQFQSLAKKYKSEKNKYDDYELKIKFDKSVLDSYYYEYKHAFQGGHPYKEVKKKYEALEKDIAKRKKNLEKMKVALTAIEKQVKKYDIESKEIHKKMEALTKPLEEAQAKIESIDFRPIAIKQVVINGYGKDGNIQWGRVDRCQTCHIAVDKSGYEDVAKKFNLTVVKDEAAKVEKIKENPKLKNWVVTEAKKKSLQVVFGTHPKRQEYLTKHPVKKFGCTSCHGGEGRAVNIRSEVFGHLDKAHAYNHLAIEPLLRGKQMQSNCFSCHEGQLQVEGAEDLTKGLKLFTQLGCQSCHLVNGYDNLHKVGPSLNKIGNKVDKTWIVDWVKNPHNYMPNTRMPNFGFSDDEAVAVTTFLLANSDKHELKNQMALNGNSANGKKLFTEVGCRGCHSAETDAKTYATRSRASNLGRVAAKVKDASWIYDWIKNPKNYDAHARMPNFRLTNQEAADITAFLMTKSPEYRKTIEKRSAKLAKKVNVKNQALIAKGKNIVRKRGCFACHGIKGFENAERIGPNLTAEGLKEPLEFDYGDSLKKHFMFTSAEGKKVLVMHNEEQPGENTSEILKKAKKSYKGTEKFDEVTNVEYTWQAWIRNKLKYPLNIYNHARAELKMPNFNLSPDELDSLVVLLKGLKKRNVPADYSATSSEPAQQKIAAQRIMAEKNCFGCHSVDGFGGDTIRKGLENHLDGVDPYAGLNKSLLPPDLSYLGEKVNPAWLYKFLKNPFPYRPAVSVRMPTYGFDDDQLNTLITGFAAANDKDVNISDLKYAIDLEYIHAGEKLANGMGCFACHIVNGKTPATPRESWAPDWADVKPRLRFDFITKWIQNPQKYQKHAVMPGYLASDKQVILKDILDGKSSEQLKALRSYILSLGKGNQVVTNSANATTTTAE